MRLSGGCLCGRVRYKAQAEPFLVITCHCRWCQRLSGAPFLTFVAFMPADLIWPNGEPTIYRSSAEVQRGFCSHCGSTISFTRPKHNVRSIFSGTLDDPDSVEPGMHCFTENQVKWLHLDDDLPRYARFPTGWDDREPTLIGDDAPDH